MSMNININEELITNSALRNISGSAMHNDKNSIKIAIIGAGGHTRSALNLLRNFYKSEQLYIFDDSFKADADEQIGGVSVIGQIDSITSEYRVFLSVGNNVLRKNLYYRFINQLVTISFIHSDATIENNVTIGNSNQIFANSYINSYTNIGNNNIINTSAILEHEVKLGDHNHIAIGAKLCGRVEIGNNCLLGAGSIVIDNISICDDVIIGAGSVVIRDIKSSGTYAGNPVRKIK